MAPKKTNSRAGVRRGNTAAARGSPAREPRAPEAPKGPQETRPNTPADPNLEPTFKKMGEKGGRT
jgi:hypothetical protein